MAYSSGSSINTNTRSDHSESSDNRATVDSVPWTIQPASKTAICHVDYPLRDKARLHVIPVTITRRNEAGDVHTPVMSQKLRRNAIVEYLSQHKLVDCVAFKLWAQKMVVAQEDANEKVFPIDQIIFLGSDGSRVDSVKDYSTKNSFLPKTVATIKAPDGTTVQESLHCELDFGRETVLSADDHDCSEYWRNIELLVRKFGPIASSKVDSRAAVSLSKTRALVQETNKRSTENHTSFQDSRTTIDGAPHIKILFRTTFKLDPHHRKLRAEIDLVPGIRGGMALLELIRLTFGTAALNTSNGQLLQNIKATLVGLNVVRTYNRVPELPVGQKIEMTGMSHSVGSIATSPPSKRAALAAMTDSQKNSHTAQVGARRKTPVRDSPGGFPDSIIVDLKPASDVPDFWKDDKKISVTQYLLQRYTELKEVKWPNLPLANIGKNTWVPLELLETAGETGTLHELPSMGYMTALLQERRANYDLERNRQKLVAFVNSQIKDMCTSHESMHLVLPKVSGELTAVEHSSKETERAQRIHVKGTGTGAAIKCGIIYVQPNGLRSTSFEGFAKSIDMLLTHHATLDQEQQIVKIDPSYTSPIVAVPDIKSLLLPPTEKTPEIKAFYDSGVDTIFAVVDERGRSKQEIRYIRAELQKFGNRKIGAVVLCVNRKDLDTRTDRSTGLPAHLPRGILLQLNAMHGNPNFVSQSLPNLPSKKYMIVGAHISHAGPSAAASCPSVAALVGSVDEALIKYTSSARLQPTLKTTPWRNDRKFSKLKHEAESEILKLETMMVERIRAWTTKRGNTDAPHIVFYRHSNQSRNQDIVEREIAAIQRASEGLTWEQGNITFDYVLVNKNAHAFSPYRNILTEDFSSKAVYEFNTADSSKETGYKYQYNVQHTLPEVLSGEQLKALTRHLNASSQQNNANLAIVLPVHYARKLAKRMYNYFHFATTNQYDNVSAVQRRLGFSNQESAKNDQQMTDMMNEYLLGYGKVEESNVAKPDRKNPWLEELDDKMFYL